MVGRSQFWLRRLARNMFAQVATSIKLLGLYVFFTILVGFSLPGLASATSRQSVAIDLGQDSVGNAVCVRYALLVRIHFEGVSRFEVVDEADGADHQLLINCTATELITTWIVQKLPKLKSSSKKSRPSGRKEVFKLTTTIAGIDDAKQRQLAYEVSQKILTGLPWVAEILAPPQRGLPVTLSVGSLNMPGITLCQPFRVAHIKGVRAGDLELAPVGYALIRTIGNFSSDAVYYPANASTPESDDERYVARILPIKGRESQVRASIRECINKNVPDNEEHPAVKKQDDPALFALPPVQELVEIKGIRQMMGLYGFNVLTKDRSAKTTGVGIRISNTVNVSKYFMLDAQGIKDVIPKPWQQKVQSNELIPQVATGSLFFSASLPIKYFYFYLGGGAVFDKVNAPYYSVLYQEEQAARQIENPAAELEIPEDASVRKAKVRGAWLLAMQGQLATIEFSLHISGSQTKQKTYQGIALDLNYKLSPTWISGAGVVHQQFGDGADGDPGFTMNAFGAHLGFLLGGNGR